MNKIIILGSGGAGKSTLAKELGQILQIPVYHLDALFWKPGWEPIGREKLAAHQEEIVAKDQWIIDGNYGSTLNIRLQAADTAVLLDYSTLRCLYRIVKRRIQYQGKTRPDMGENCKEKIDLEFFLWVARFKRGKTPAIKEKLRQVEKLQIFHHTSPKQTRDFLTSLNTVN